MTISLDLANHASATVKGDVDRVLQLAETHAEAGMILWAVALQAVCMLGVYRATTRGAYIDPSNQDATEAEGLRAMRELSRLMKKVKQN
jgi:hypothetical protein